MTQFDRQYRFAAGPAGRAGFEIGETSAAKPTALHISFSVDKCDSETPNTAKISLWNLNKEHLAILNQKNCIVTLKAGYGNHMPLIFVGAVTFTSTELDGVDRETQLECADGGIELRDTYVSLSYAGSINTKKIIEDTAKAMGITLNFSYNAAFSDLRNGFSFVGKGRAALDKACASSGLQWQIYNGILQVKRKSDTMNRQVYVLSADSGLVGIPKRVTYAADDKNAGEQSGWEVEYLLNGTVGIGDYIRMESKYVTGYFRIRSVEMRGDNLEGDWMCAAKLIEA